MLLLEENETNDWWAMIRPGKRARVGTEIILTAPAASSPSPPRSGGESRGEEALSAQGENEIRATVLETNDEGHRRLRFSGTKNILAELDRLGEIPLPPYIDALAERRAQVQSKPIVNATKPFTPSRPAPWPRPPLDCISPNRSSKKSAHSASRFVSSRCTWASAHSRASKPKTLSDHVMHEERYELSDETARIINEAKRENRRVIAVGTTTVRVLESVAAQT